MDAISQTRLALINPRFSDTIEHLAELLEAEGIVIRVTQGLRSWQQQAVLYAQGRTQPGNIVTNAPPGHSWHQFGLAVDVAPFDAQGSPDWNSNDAQWKRIIGLGESLGLVSGSTFIHCPDNPHFQMTGIFPESPNDEVRQIFLGAGMSEVWKEAGLFDTDSDSPETLST